MKNCSQNNFPLVSTIIHCRNEERFIGKCLDSIISQDYPKDKLEVLVVDGMSEDGTRGIANEYAQKYPFIKLLNNPKRVIPCAMNIGIKNANGEIIMEMSAHSTYPKYYISKCVQYLLDYSADNVGGVCKIMPRENTTIAKSIAIGLAHPFASGNTYVKIGSNKLRWADTAAFGCYRKEIFEKIGLFNENLHRGSDMDFNRRLREAGGKILLVPEIVINYYADANLNAFWKHNFADGIWITYPIKFRSKAWSWRHWVPFAFVSGLIVSIVLSVFSPVFQWLFFGIVGAYALVTLGASMQIAIQEKKFSYLLALPVIFASRHIAYGLGALFGLIRVLMPGKHWQGHRSKSI
jgi:glycosyltransferase involved in cell wall biosynthesis